MTLLFTPSYQYSSYTNFEIWSMNVYVYIHIHMHACTHTYIHIYVNIYIYNIYVNIYLYKVPEWFFPHCHLGSIQLAGNVFLQGHLKQFTCIEWGQEGHLIAHYVAHIVSFTTIEQRKE